MKIALQQLISKGACWDQVCLFKRRYGKSVTVTRRECLAVAGLFNWGWAAINLLTTRQRFAYYREINHWWAPRGAINSSADLSAVRALAFWKASRG